MPPLDTRKYFLPNGKTFTLYKRADGTWTANYAAIFGTRKLTAADWLPTRKSGSEHAEPNLIDSDLGYPDSGDADDYTEHLSDDADRDDEDDEQQKDKAMKDPMRRLKSLDAVEICKTMSNAGSALGLSEHDLVSLIDTYAKAHGTTFAELFTKQDDTGLALRKAVDILE